MKKGDMIAITKTPDDYAYYFKVGDQAILTRRDTKDQWWADFTINDKYSEDGQWCLSDGVEFVRIWKTRYPKTKVRYAIQYQPKAYLVPRHFSLSFFWHPNDTGKPKKLDSTNIAHAILTLAHCRKKHKDAAFNLMRIRTTTEVLEVFEN